MTGVQTCALPIYGCALSLIAAHEAVIEVPGVGGRTPHRLSQRALAEVIEPRAEELFMLARAEIERAGAAGMLTSGIVLTGGGAVLTGMADLAERVFRMPVRLGVPLHLSGLVDVVASPMYSTAVGLVLHGLKQHGQAGGRSADGMLRPLERVGHRMIEWIRELF